MDLRELVRLSLAEDVGPGDVTTSATVDPRARGRARIYAKQDLVLCGQAAAEEVFLQCGARYPPARTDGERLSPGEDAGHAEGPLAALITAERCALNFLMRLSGIATHVRDCVDGVEGLRVLDTRKTTPLHRALEKHAVRCGGASNHRFGLYDGVLVKDNHIVAAGGVTEAVRLARAHAHPLLRVECEVESLEELELALAAGADVILLDNMDDAKLREAVARTAGRARLEASGNMTAERLRRLAGIGIDQVSMGGLIHQARWADLSMRVLPPDAQP
jgi:nicotinate-nucleotide pyrophosphorylase (carboxylating)